MATILPVQCRACGTAYWVYVPKKEMAETLGISRMEAIEEDQRDADDGDLEMAAAVARAAGAVFFDSSRERLERCACGAAIHVDIP
jgi:hypothetical protein